MSVTPTISSPESVPLPDGDVISAKPTDSWPLQLFLQISHRLAAVALFATIAVWAMGYLAKDFHVALATAGGAADLGFCAALIARLMTGRWHPARREANGVAIFNLVLFVLALYLMIFARIEVIRAAGAEFFTPSQPLSSHG